MKQSQSQVVTRSKVKLHNGGKRIGKWGTDEHERFLEALETYGLNFEKIAEEVGTRDAIQIRSHAQKHFERVKREQLMKKRLGLRRRGAMRRTQSKQEQKPQSENNSENHKKTIALKTGPEADSSSQSSRNERILTVTGAAEDLKNNLPLSEGSAHSVSSSTHLILFPVSQKVSKSKKSEPESERIPLAITNETSKAEETPSIPTSARSDVPTFKPEIRSQKINNNMMELLAQLQILTSLNNMSQQPYPARNPPLYTNLGCTSSANLYDYDRGFDQGYKHQILPHQSFYNYLQSHWSQYNRCRPMKLSDFVNLGSSQETDSFLPGNEHKKLKQW